MRTLACVVVTCVVSLSAYALNPPILIDVQDYIVLKDTRHSQIEEMKMRFDLNLVEAAVVFYHLQTENQEGKLREVMEAQNTTLSSGLSAFEGGDISLESPDVVEFATLHGVDEAVALPLIQLRNVVDGKDADDVKPVEALLSLYLLSVSSLLDLNGN